MIRSTAFGNNVDLDNNKVDFVLRNVDGPLNSVDAAVLLRDAYDDTYGIYGSSAASNHPFSTVAPHKIEDVNNTSQLAYYIRRFREHQVNKIFGIGLLEFLSLPRGEAEIILKECTLAKKTDNQAMSDIENELKGVLNK